MNEREKVADEVKVSSSRVTKLGDAKVVDAAPRRSRMTDWGDYTPGPWTISRWGQDGDEWPTARISIGPMGRALAISPRYPAENMEADARLISKAYLIPRLEVALEGVLASHSGVVLGPTANLIEQYDQQVKDARALLDELRSP